jgi:hypothetical protein
MENGGGKLVFDLDGRRLAVDMGAVDSVVEVPRVFFIPGQSDPVKGIISRRGDAVAVVDMRKVLGLPPSPQQRNKIIILREGFRALGLYIGGGGVSFMWREGEGETEAPEGVETLDWLGLYDEAASKLMGADAV